MEIVLTGNTNNLLAMCSVRSTMKLFNRSRIINDTGAWGWGGGDSGLIGDGYTLNRSTPVKIHGVIPNKLSVSKSIDSNGKIWSWGPNSSGSIGDNTTIDKCTPVAIGGVNKTFCEISSCGDSTLAIDKNGKAWGWGSNSSGQLGNNATNATSTPIAVCGNHTFCKIYSDNPSVSLGIDNNNKLWAWGTNVYGQIGNNTNTAASTPVAVYGNHTFCEISVGPVYPSVLSIDNNGKAWGWGRNTSTQIGDNTSDHRNTPVAVCGNHTFCKIRCGQVQVISIDNHNNVWGWGVGTPIYPDPSNSYSTPININITATDIAVNFDTSYFLINGILSSFGGTSLGRLGNDTSGPPSQCYSVVTVCNASIGTQHLKNNIILNGL